MVNHQFLNTSPPTKVTYEPKPKVVVRLTTESYQTQNGFALKKNFTFLKRKCEGFNFVDEELKMVGADEAIRKIINLNKVEDGIYQIITVNELTDWETGYLDDWDFELIPI
jgi:hypothetical protein